MEVLDKGWSTGAEGRSITGAESESTGAEGGSTVVEGGVLEQR